MAIEPEGKPLTSWEQPATGTRVDEHTMILREESEQANHREAEATIAPLRDAGRRLNTTLGGTPEPPPEAPR